MTSENITCNKIHKVHVRQFGHKISLTQDTGGDIGIVVWIETPTKVTLAYGQKPIIVRNGHYVLASVRYRDGIAALEIGSSVFVHHKGKETMQIVRKKEFYNDFKKGAKAA